jgi:autoinducer 2-degrading protein
MIVTVVNVYVKEENIQEFIAATIENHNASVQEPGNLRFDVLQNREDPARFTLYEAYESDETSKAHKETAHYARWRDGVADMMAEPRSSVKYESVFLPD